MNRPEIPLSLRPLDVVARERGHAGAVVDAWQDELSSRKGATRSA